MCTLIGNVVSYDICILRYFGSYDSNDSSIRCWATICFVIPLRYSQKQ